MPGDEERRKHVRYELLAQVQLHAGGDVAILDVSNISAGGALIALRRGEHPRVQKNEDVSIFIDVGDDSDGAPIALDAPARVVRVDLGSATRQPTIAVQWTSQDPDFIVSLARLLGRVRELVEENPPEAS